jgi:hypothetical protein
MDQTGRSLKQRYSDHIRYIRCNNPLSAYSNRILLQAHEFGSMQNNVTLIHRDSKGRLVDIWKKKLLKILMNLNWFKNTYQGKSALCLLYFLLRNYVTPLPEMVYETTAVLQFDNCHITYNTLLLNLACITYFRHTIN